MNRELVENILAVITTATTKAVVVKALLKLRTDLVKDRDGIVLFREAGGVKPIVRLLTKPHEQILEVALSILGNCCTDEESSIQALDCKVSMPLATILKSIPNAVIQCRACRLLGNLAKVDCARLLATHCPALAQSVCQIIEDASDVQTRMMALRACRFLLADPQFLKHFLQAQGFTHMLRILAAVMKNDTEAAQKTTADSEAAGPSENCAGAGGLKKNQHREKYFEEVARNLEGVRSDIFDHEVLKHAPCAFSTAYAMPAEKAALDLACEILKCLLVMSELQMNLSVWESLNRAGSTFAPIVFFVWEEANKHRSVALKILSNFAKNPGAFFILSSADAIVGACELLVSVNMERPLSESEIRHCINVVCVLSTDACNRSKIRRSGALRKLIAMVRESKSQTEIASILFLLNNFQYDNMSMDLMLKEGLISVLIKELNAYLTSDDEYHKRKRDEKQQQVAKKRKRPGQAYESFCKVIKICEPTAADIESPSSSPRSYVGASSSPCSSRSMSPVGSKFSGDESTTADADDETYSPICSDDEGDEEDDDDNNEQPPPDVDELATEAKEFEDTNRSATDNSEIMKLLDIACRADATEDNILDKEDDDDVSQDVTIVKLPQLTPRSTIDIIENLIFRVTLLVNKRPELGKPETITTLIKAIHVFGGNNNFSGSLINILLESQFFAQVIKHGIPHQLFQLTKLDEMRRDGCCNLLDTLTCVGESNYGKAELARLLRSDDALSQNRAAIAVAHIIKSQKLLYQFLNDGNALTHLLGIILRSQPDEFTAEAVDALTAMSRTTLGIEVEQRVKRSDGTDYEEFVEEEALEQLQNADMRFVVHSKKPEESAVAEAEVEDAGTEADKDATATASESTLPPVTVAFNKKLLCKSSVVFHTMLNSSFREGNENEIHLHSCSPAGLRYFLNLIWRQSQKLRMNIPPPHQYHALLEAFEMARVYIMPAMELFMQQLLVSRLNASNCLSVLEWALNNYHAELTATTINYYLCSALATEEKVALFRSADYSTYSSEWFQMIMDAVFMRCSNGI